MPPWVAKLAGTLGCALMLLTGPAGAAGAADPTTLTIVSGPQERSWTRQELLKDRRLVSVTVDDDNLKRRLTSRLSRWRHCCTACRLPPMP